MDTEETSVVEPTEDVETSTETEPSESSEDERKYAGKYTSVEELEKAYQSATAEATRMAQKLSQKKTESGEVDVQQQMKDMLEAQDLKQDYSAEQVDKALALSTHPLYASRSITEIVHDLYGSPKPSGLSPKSKKKTVQGRWTPEKVEALSDAEYTKHRKEIIDDLATYYAQ